MESLEEVARHLADAGTAPTSMVFKGIRVDTYWVARHSLLLALLSLWYAFWNSIAGLRRGLYLKVWLPVLVSADLYLESRSSDLASEDPLEAHFSWSCTNDHRLRRYLKGDLLDVMVRFAKEYRVVMTDQFVEFGPLFGTPATSAALLNALVDALPRPDSDADEWHQDIGSAVEEDHRWVALRVTLSRSQATEWRLHLEGSGVACELLGYESNPPWGVATPAIPIQLFVPAHQVKYAEEVLVQPTQTELVADGSCHLCGARVGRGASRCPGCGAALPES